MSVMLVMLRMILEDDDEDERMMLEVSWLH